MRITTRVGLGIVLAAIVPLTAAVAISTLVARNLAERAVTVGNRNTATQVAGRMQDFLQDQRRMLETLAHTVASRSHLDNRQIDAELRIYVLDFGAFHEVAIYDQDVRVKHELRVGVPRALTEERTLARKALGGSPAFGRYYLARDMMGVALAVPIPGGDDDEPEGALVAQLAVDALWGFADEIRVGETGYALVVDPDGRVLAGGNGPLKRSVLLGEKVRPETGLIEIYRAGVSHAGTRTGALGQEVLGAEVPLPRELGLLVSVEQPTSEAFAGANALPWQLGLIGLLAGAIGLFISILGSRRPLRAIADLASAVERVARGDFFARASERGDDELAGLARDFNRMTIRLRELTEDLRRHERLSVFSRIAAGLAHDLKHPIKNLENQARLMTEMPDDPRFRETFRRAVERDFAALERFLGNLHDLTQTAEMTLVPLDPRTLAEAAAEGVLGQAVERKVEVRVDVPEGSPRLLGDRITLERALKNLLVNAIEASPEGASVRIVAEITEGEVCVAVVDDGPGIPPERLERLFEEFSTTKRSGKGLGLGLALTSRFVREQGGAIECDSVVGRGSTFRIRLPRQGTRREVA